MKIDLIGVPLDLGSERIGVDMGPNALRCQKFVENLTRAGLDINDLGNLPCPSLEEVDEGDPNTKYLDPIASVCRSLSLQTQKSTANNKHMLVIGGDHSVAIGSVSGAAQAISGKIGLIWIDAHGDCNTTDTTLSGNIHGMPLAVLLGHGHKDLTGISQNSCAVEYQNVLGIGLKDLDPAEKEFIKFHKINTFSIKDILAEGLRPILLAIDDLIKRTDSIWVSFDLDGVDASEAPGVGMPNKGGLTYREIYAIAEHIGTNSDILGLDIVEYNPVNDIEHRTAILATELTAKLFGKDYSNYSAYMDSHAIHQREA